MYINCALKHIIPCERLDTQLGRTLPVSYGTAVLQFSQTAFGMYYKRD